jgi:hypothetical protein
MAKTDFLWLSNDALMFYERNNLSFGEQSTSFLESLYLNFKYINGNFLTSPFNDNLFYDYVDNSWLILIELCKRGIYVQYGCQSSKVMRSCFNFTTVINDDIELEFILFLKQLYSAGVNVCVQKVKNGKIKKEIVFASDCGKTIYSDNFKKKCILPQGFHSHGYPQFGQYNSLFTGCITPYFGISGYIQANCSPKEYMKCKNHSLYYCELWNQKFDVMGVEDILLYYWIKFNAKYGVWNMV